MPEKSEELGADELVPAGAHEAPYQAVFGDVSRIIDAARESAVRSVNAAMTAAYWLVGHRIVEFEQSGEERAEYGAALIERLAADLTARFGRGFSRQNIQYMRLFYLSYPPDKICQTASGILGRAPQLPIRQTASSESSLATLPQPRSIPRNTKIRSMLCVITSPSRPSRATSSRIRNFPLDMRPTDTWPR